MAATAAIDRFFRQRPWIQPLSWLMVVAWALYQARGLIAHSAKFIWSPYGYLLQYWWAIAQTLFKLVKQLCIVLPITAIAYFITMYALIALNNALTLLKRFAPHILDPSLKRPPPASFGYTHTHSNGESATVELEEEDLAEIIAEEMRRIFRERSMHAQAQAQDERNWREQSNGSGSGRAQGSGKSKRKGKKKKN